MPKILSKFMPNLEMPSQGQEIKKESRMKKGEETPEAAELKKSIKLLDRRIDIRQKPRAKETEAQKERRLVELVALEQEIDEAQEKLAETLSPKYVEPEARESSAVAEKLREQRVEEKTAAVLKAQRNKPTKELLGGVRNDLLERHDETAAALAELRALEEERVRKEKKLEKPETELEESLAELRRMEAEKTEEGKQALKKVHEKIAGPTAKPTDEIYFQNWPKKEEYLKPKEKPEEAKKPEEKFAPPDEAWFGEGEKAGESDEEMKKLEETAKKRSSAGVSPKLPPEAPKATVELVQKAEEKLNAAVQALEKENFDVDELSRAGGFDRFSIGLNIFTKRGRLLRRLYKDYVDAVNNRDLALLRAGNVSAERQKLRGMAGGSRRTPSGGPMGRL
ncbi:MAG: hypothetical protein AAB731_04095 [Patescibacteria group bacterium]